MRFQCGILRATDQHRGVGQELRVAPAVQHAGNDAESIIQHRTRIADAARELLDQGCGGGAQRVTVQTRFMSRTTMLDRNRDFRTIRQQRKPFVQVIMQQLLGGRVVQGIKAAASEKRVDHTTDHALSEVRESGVAHHFNLTAKRAVLIDFEAAEHTLVQSRFHMGIGSRG